MIDVMDLITMAKGSRLDASEAETMVAGADIAQMKSIAHQLGIPHAQMPQDGRSLARILVASLAPELPRSGAAEATAEREIGHYTRIETQGRNKVAISSAVTQNEDGRLMVRQTLFQPIDELDGEAGGMRDADGPPQIPVTPPPETPLTPATATPTKATVVHTRVNIKVIFWIPYAPNALPTINQILPSGTPPWENQMTFTESAAMRALMATGNPEPPKNFPGAADFAAFVQSKEYRGILDIDLMVCCDLNGLDEYKKSVNPMVGYTPPMSDLDDPTKVHDDHTRRESLGSQINRALNDPNLDPVSVLGLPSFMVPTIPVVEALKKNKKPSTGPESFTQGNQKLVQSPWIQTGNCVNGIQRLGIQVNNLENILYYALTKRLLPYMWGEAMIRLCCGGLLNVTVIGSSIPSKALYINNTQVARYDMTSQSINEIKVSVPFAPPPDDAANLDDPSVLGFASGSQNPVVQLSTTKTLPMQPDCPKELPKDWLYDGPQFF